MNSLLSPEPEVDPTGEAAVEAALLGVVPELPGRVPAALREELVAFRRDLHMHPE
ncbi:MAG: amidohydrolase, partial [Streptomyces sp.]